jgi:rhamnosyltransferase subunit B
MRCVRILSRIAAPLSWILARILFTSFGSYGDLYPYIAIGIQLQKLCHRVTLATSAGYREKVESEGLGFVPVRPNVSLEDREMKRLFFDRRRGSERVIRAIAELVRESYEDTLNAASDADVIVTHPIALAAVAVAEKRRLPWISSVLAPISFLSAYDPPAPPLAPWIISLRHFGPGVMRIIWNLAKRSSRNWIRPVIELRQELGLPTGSNPIFEGSHAPGLVLALFSSILAAPQPDWPKQTLIAGFPFYDGPEKVLPVELEAFLQSGPPPVVFTLGSSAVGAAGNFYSESLKAVNRLRVRAVFLTGSHTQTLEESISSDVFVWPAAPHALLFARASAIVHQGGVGTTAQAMRSGRPMLVVPFAHDQFDNAERVRRLGMAKVVPRSRYRASTAAAKLKSLLENASYRQAALDVSNIVQAECGSAVAAQAIDEYARRPRYNCLEL